MWSKATMGLVETDQGVAETDHPLVGFDHHEDVT
jgi:hypothetical protein